MSATTKRTKQQWEGSHSDRSMVMRSSRKLSAITHLVAGAASGPVAEELGARDGDVSSVELHSHGGPVPTVVTGGGRREERGGGVARAPVAVVLVVVVGIWRAGRRRQELADDGEEQQQQQRHGGGV